MQTLGTLCDRRGAEKGLPGSAGMFWGHRVAGGACQSGPSPRAPCRAVRRQGKGRRKQEGQRWQGEDRVKKLQKSRANLLTSPDSAAPLVISVGYRGCQSRL